MPQHPEGPRSPPAESALELEEITTREGLRGLRVDWDALEARAAPRSIFLHHAWADAAWSWREHEGAPLILVMRRDGQARGIVPLCRHRGPGGARTLAWLSVPDNQEADLLAAPDDRAAVVEALADWLVRPGGGWSRLSLAQLPAHGASLPILLSALQARRMPTARRAAGQNHAIDLTDTWEDFYARRSRRLKKGNNLVANRLHRAGDVAVTRLTGERITPAVVATLRQLSGESWKQGTGTTFDRPGPGAFLDCLVEHGRREGWLVVWLLELDGRAIASELHLEYGGRAHALRADYAEDAAELSPGSYLNWRIIERLFDSGLQRYELGPGANPYKQRWSEQELPLATMDAWRPTAAGRLRAGWHLRLRPRLAALKRRADGNAGC